MVGAVWSRRLAGVLVTVLTAALAGVVVAPASLAGRVPQPECSLGSGSVIGINSVLFSSEGPASAVAGPFAVDIAGGTYMISMTSYDNHSEKLEQTQSREQWYIEGRWHGQVVVQLPTVPDLPEGVDYQVYDHPDPVELPDIDEVLVRHAAYPDDSSPNSVVAVCASVTVVGGGTSTTNPPDSTTSTTQPEGGTSTTQPGDGTTITTSPEGGTTTTTQVGGGTSTTQPSDGTTTTTQPGDGTTTTTTPTSTTSTTVPPTVLPTHVTSTTVPETLPETGSSLSTTAVVAAFLIITGVGLAVGTRARTRI